jgi:hypothetical protein
MIPRLAEGGAVRLLVLSALLSTASVTTGAHEFEDLPPGVVHVDSETATEHDRQLMAEQTGIPRESLNTALDFQEAFTLYGMDVLIPRFEEQIAAIWVDPAPATRGYVRFVGEVPEDVRLEAVRRGLDVELIGGDEFSMADQVLRSETVAKALVWAGYQNFVTGPDHASGKIAIQLYQPEGALEPSVVKVLPKVQEYFAKFGPPDLVGRAAEIKEDDLEIVVSQGPGPTVHPDITIGSDSNPRDEHEGGVYRYQD